MGFCRSMGIPVFYTEAVKEDSGIVIMTNVHNILPKSRQERLKVPICIRGIWDGVTIDELKPEAILGSRTSRSLFGGI